MIFRIKKNFLGAPYVVSFLGFGRICAMPLDKLHLYLVK